jgi:DNA-binding winged helix-turn-helix (wHTH) protein/tetratricopeptide (TPR) repeat protein
MSREIKVLYEFGNFRCDPREHLLLSNGRPVSVSPKSFEILVALIQSNGRLLTKDELMQQVWPDTFVEEANLTVNISALRKVLGETPTGEQYIETVPKRGYRFLAPVAELQGEGKPGPSGPAPEAERGAGEASPGVIPAEAPRGRFRLRWQVIGLLLAAVFVSAIVALRRPGKLTDNDTVVLADFVNTTGDPVFDGALRQGLSSQLEQSPFLNLLSDERIAQTMALMAQPKDARLTPALAREVCQRTASAAVLDGAIAQVGTQYLLTLKAVNCSSGESLGSAEAQAVDRNHVLDAMGQLASEIRNKLGESLASVQKYDAPPEKVTTASLEALKAYSLGWHAMTVEGNYAGAIPQFQRAINLDPNFAMAYARMGTSYLDVDETTLAAESAQKAYDLRKRVSEREEFYIASHYELLVTGNLEAARKIDELSAQIYPRDTPYTNLGLIYCELGDYEKAFAAFQDGLRFNPETGNRYANLITGYLQLNRLDEAKAAAREAESHHLDVPEIHLNIYWVDFIRHDIAGMEREAAGMMGKPGYEDQMFNYEADTAFCGGQLAKARGLTRRAIEASRKEDEKEPPALYLADAAVREALVGNAALAKKQAQAALVISNSRDAVALSAFALALAGESAEARRLADDLGKRFPRATLVQSTYLPSIRSADLIRSGDAGKAIEVLEAAASHELGGNVESVSFVLYPVYLRGEAYLAAKQGAAAAAEFQKILDHPGAARNEPIGALAHLELGRAYALSGDIAKAKGAYNDFLTLWKDADPDIPILIAAKAEYAKLH